MAMYCFPYSVETHSHSSYTTIKMERDSGEEDERTSRPSSTPGIPIATVMTANENWRGKNDPAERRRIQNRLNQRAFRQRQRAGESPKQYKPRSMSRSSPTQEEESDDDGDSVKSEGSPAASGSFVEGRQSAPPRNARPNGVADQQTGQVWDELAQIINRNFMSAAVTNAQHVGIDPAALQSGTIARTPRLGNRQISSTLTPIELQYQVGHDPIIDTIPHARLRFNILRGIATSQLDAAAFSRSIRSSGALEESNGCWQRGGVVIWSSPEQVASWELSEPFVRRWSFLLQGCEDLVTATNAWRRRRSERLFPTSFGNNN